MKILNIGFNKFLNLFRAKTITPVTQPAIKIEPRQIPKTITKITAIGSSTSDEGYFHTIIITDDHFKVVKNYKDILLQFCAAIRNDNNSRAVKLSKEIPKNLDDPFHDVAEIALIQRAKKHNEPTEYACSVIEELKPDEKSIVEVISNLFQKKKGK